MSALRELVISFQTFLIEIGLVLALKSPIFNLKLSGKDKNVFSRVVVSVQ